MKVFISVHLEYAASNPPGMSQRVTAALALIGLGSQIRGHKGSVHLPQHLYADTRHLAVSKEEPLQYWRRVISDELSAVLGSLGFRGQFFVNLSGRSCWGFRPVPRREMGNTGSDLGSNDLEGLQLPEQGTPAAVTQAPGADHGQ